MPSTRTSPPRVHQFGRKAALAVSLLGVLGLAGSGCVAIVPYSPDEGAVARLGEEQAETRLGALLTQSTVPRYGAVSVEEDYFSYTLHQVAMGAFYTTHQIASQNQVYFSNIKNIELYENNVVYLRGPGNGILLQATFPTKESATEFVDLIASYRSESAGASGG